MSHYTPARQVIQIALTELAGLPEISELARFENGNPEITMASLEEFGSFPSEVIAPSNYCRVAHMLLVRVDDVPSGTQGISLFVVPNVLVPDDDTKILERKVVTSALHVNHILPQASALSPAVIHGAEAPVLN